MTHKLIGSGLAVLAIVVLIVGQRWSNSAVAEYARQQREQR